MYGPSLAFILFQYFFCIQSLRVSGPSNTRMEKKINIDQLNQLNSTEFLNLFKNVIELWPNAAETVYKQKPFSNLSDVADEFDSYLENLSIENKVAILRLHPDLAGKLLNENNITQESAQEQASAGLNQLTAEQKKQLVQLSTEYREKFDFPFVICVRQNNKIEKILEGFRSRLPNTREEEIINGTNEVKKIGRLRLGNIIDL